MLNKLGNEVVQIGLEENGYFYEGAKKKSGFAEWLQCYYQEGMRKCKDSKGRTMWYSGDVGRLFKPGENGRNTRPRGDAGKNTPIKKEKMKKEKMKKEKIKKEKIKKEKIEKEKIKKEKIKKEKLEEVSQG